MTDEKNTQKKAPGKAYRKGMTLVELIRKFPDDATAEAWIAEIRWPDGPECPHCGHNNVQHPTAHKTMPYRCRGKGCRKWFSVRTGTVMRDSKLGYQEWAIAVYLFNTSLKSVSSMKLHRDLGISQKSAWHLAHRIRECWEDLSGDPFEGPVEVDESHFGGKAKNMHASVRRERITGRGAVDKTTVVAVKDRDTGRVAATVVDNTDAAMLQGFVTDHAKTGAMVYTDEHRSYVALLLYLWVVLERVDAVAPRLLLVVRRGFDLVEGGSSAADFCDDLFGGLVPDEGLGVVVPVFGPDLDGIDEVGHAGEHASA